MNEKTTKRRDWVKNAAIIFLSVLLVLTFFSNTIMNYSLPEVATQYVQSGSITAKVRGTGTIEASDPYNLIVNDTRVIESVAVKVGDDVEKGDTIFYLEDQESEELKLAQEELVTLEVALDTAILSYETKILDGTLSAEVLAGVQSGNTNSLATAQAKIQAAKDKVTSLENTKAGYEASLANITSQETFLANSATYDAAQKEAEMNKATKEKNSAQADLETAKAELEAAKAKLEAATANVEAIESLLGGSREEAEAKAEQARVAMDKAKMIMENAKVKWDNDPDGKCDEKTLSEDEKEMFAGMDGMSWENIYNLKKSLYEEAKSAYESLKSFVDGYAANEVKLVEARKAQSAAAAKVSDCNNKITSLTAEIESLTEKISNLSVGSTSTDSAATQKSLADQKAQLTAAITSIDAQIAQAQEEQTQVLTDMAGELNLESQSDEIARARKKVNEKKEEIAKIQEETANAVITAPVSGKITSLSYAAGESTKPGENAAVIQVAGKGFTTSFSVTNDQAKKVTVGDVAELQNSWYYNDLSATLTAIKPDTTNPSQNKLLVFEVTGEDVTAGQSISLSVGQKSANYDLIVPNSAIREDNKGKFILIVESKSSPLGTRYIATRVDVEVLASDDTQTAISGALYGYEYVITTATKPVEAGKQVRLTD